MSWADEEQASVEERVRRVREWAGEEPLSRAVIDAVWRAEHGTDYAPTVQTYRAAVRLVVGHLWDEGDVPRPVWDPEPGLADVTPLGTRLIDALMFHVGHMSSAGALRWGVVTDPDSAAYGHPFVVPHPHLSVGAIPGVFAWVVAGRSGLSALEKPLRRAGAEDDPGAGSPLRDEEFAPTKARKARPGRWGGLLGGRVRTWDLDLPAPLRELPEVEASIPLPRPAGDLVRSVRPSDRPDFTHVVWVDEAALAEWGSARFHGYESRLAAQPGIDTAYQEDREPVYVLAPTLTADEVLAAARRAATSQ